MVGLKKLGTLFFFSLLLVAPASAQWSIHMTLRSFHFDRSTDYNEWNIGFGVGYDVGFATVQTGIYRNSYSKASFYGSLTQAWPENSFFKVGGQIGFATGYDEGKVVPVVGPGIGVGKNPFLQVAYILDRDNGLLASRIVYEL